MSKKRKTMRNYHEKHDIRIELQADNVKELKPAVYFSKNSMTFSLDFGAGNFYLNIGEFKDMNHVADFIAAFRTKLVLETRGQFDE